MKEVEIRFDTKEFQRQLDRLGGAEVGRILAQGVYEGTQIVANEARRAAPDSGLPAGSSRKLVRGVNYGKLKENIRTTDVRVTAYNYRGRVTTGQAFWAYFVEYGLKAKQYAGKPFMRPSADRARPAAIKQFSDAVHHAVQQAFR